MVNSIGSNIRNARKNKKLTQIQLANILGVSNSTISDWENDNHRPDPDMIQFICGALGVEPNDIIPPGSPSEKFDEWHLQFNKTHEPMMVDKTERKIVENYRSADPFDKTTVLRTLNIVNENIYETSLPSSAGKTMPPGKKRYVPTEEDIQSLVARNGKKFTREEAIEFISDMLSDDDEDE